MKNSICIDIDTERQHPIIFTKPSDIAPPQTKEEATEMIVNDIAAISHALKYLIMMTDDNGYAKKEELVEASIKTINEALILQENQDTNGTEEQS